MERESYTLKKFSVSSMSKSFVADRSRESSIWEDDTGYGPHKPLPLFPVRVSEGLHVPSKLKVWAVIVTNLAVGLFIAIIPFKPVWIHKDGGMTAGLHTVWVFTTTVLATIIKMWTTGIMQTLWAHVTMQPAPDAETAAEMANYSRSMLGIGRFRHAFRRPQVIGFMFLMAAALASVSAAIAPTNVVVTQLSTVNTTGHTTSHCFFTTDDGPGTDFNWRWPNGSYFQPIADTITESVDCPWCYTLAILKPGLSPPDEAAYAVSGVLVQNSSIGAPVSIPGGFDQIFGTAEVMSKAPKKYYQAAQIHKAEACLPRIARNPVKCTKYPITWQPYNETLQNLDRRSVDQGHTPAKTRRDDGSGEEDFTSTASATSGSATGEPSVMACFKGTKCQMCSWSTPQSQAVNFTQHQSSIKGDNDTVGAAAICTFEVGATALSKLLDNSTSNTSNMTGLECLVDMAPAIDVNTKLTYWNKEYENGSPVADSTFPWQVSGSSSQGESERCTLPNNGSIFFDPQALASGPMGPYQMLFERAVYDDMFWPTLWQLASEIQQSSRGLNFENSQNAFEDALGVSAGAAIGAHWGSLIHQASPSLDSSYEVEWVVLGPRQPWAIIFAIPSFICAGVVLYLEFRMNSVLSGKKGSGYQALPGAHGDVQHLLR